MFSPNNIFKRIITMVAVLNIVVMMLFEYGLPSYATSTANNQNSNNSNEQASKDNNSNMGTIESVEKEKSSRETEAADNALAKNEEEPEETENLETESDPDAPLLELTDDHIYLKVGERFNYMSYIKTMEDVDGSDLSRYIHLDKDVDTSEAGEIELTYRITSAITGKSSSKVLLITIEE